MSVSFDDAVRIGQKGTVTYVTVTYIDRSVSPAVERPVDLTNATLLNVVYKAPDHTTITKVADGIIGSPTDGQIYHKDTIGIFNLRGRWQARGLATFANGDEFPGSWGGFPVDD